MEVKTYRAKSLQQALQWIRKDLGSDAAVLHTREIRTGLWGLLGERQLEVIAGVGVNVPSRFADQENPRDVSRSEHIDDSSLGEFDPVPLQAEDYRAKYRRDLQEEMPGRHSLVEDLCRRFDEGNPKRTTPALSELLEDLIEADVSEEFSRELIDRLRSRSNSEELDDAFLLRARLARMIADEIQCCGPVQLTPGHRRIVALIGPTGVGKTTTIAKLAANFHLRENRRVGLLTVDTYRIAAVDQLRTYADIIDLPMEVVSTPREMRMALARLADVDLVLMDTAGRSPGDDARIQELKSMLYEAQADEVHLVVSGVSALSSLKSTAARFAAAGATGLLLTKLDEATGLGHLLSLVRACRLPLSYVTTGQHVPADILPADARKLARRILRLEGGR